MKKNFRSSELKCSWNQKGINANENISNRKKSVEWYIYIGRADVKLYKSGKPEDRKILKLKYTLVVVNFSNYSPITQIAGIYYRWFKVLLKQKHQN